MENVNIDVKKLVPRWSYIIDGHNRVWNFIGIYDGMHLFVRDINPLKDKIYIQGVTVSNIDSIRKIYNIIGISYTEK